MSDSEILWVQRWNSVLRPVAFTCFEVVSPHGSLAQTVGSNAYPCIDHVKARSMNWSSTHQNHIGPFNNVSRTLAMWSEVHRHRLSETLCCALFQNSVVCWYTALLCSTPRIFGLS